ncbi:MAG: hypothetical protein J5735_00020 [Prevotella sp.]|jgi:hypothetical protein|nr:hypothetical protein [Prevotella sp.]
MNKKYIKPSIVVEATLLKAFMETVSVKGEINDPSGYTVNAKDGNVWDDEEEE